MNKKILTERGLKILRFEKTIDESGVTKLTPILSIPANQEVGIPFDPKSPHHLLSRRRTMRNMLRQRP